MAITSIVMGKVINEVELKTSKSGKDFVRLAVADTTGFGDNRKDRVVNVTFFDAAERVARVVKKGSVVQVLANQVEISTSEGREPSLAFIGVSFEFVPFNSSQGQGAAPSAPATKPGPRKPKKEAKPKKDEDAVDWESDSDSEDGEAEVPF